MTTLVTGAFGCLGSWVVRGLLAALDEFARLQKDGRLDARELT